MNVNVIGGGPGGLYASALVKKRFPDWEVDVYERDPADNTYGWGVVFSDATLSNLREADARTHERITDAFARWDPIDVHYDGEYFRCDGHSFAGIMRADLLSILQDRCEELGVGLHHGVDVEDPDAYREDADLLVGADGLNSTVRERYAEEFDPDVTEGNAKFAWFGTEKPFDVFTFVFRENEHGLWRVHAYPGRKSTFIVECTEDTWRAAGMDDRSEGDALAYFEDLFADHLDGYDLLSKLYAWRNFPVVECDRWHHDDVVLLGDAAHTAHFTIGSGTKLAMEDAIGLADAFQEHGEDRESVLNRYEMDRRPRVEGLQDAAERSRKYFENVERYHRNLRPRQFAFNLLTRSGRISYESLKNRDPEFTDDYDRWFDRLKTENGRGRVVAAPPMFNSFDARGVTVPNRASLYRGYVEGASDGHPTDDYLAEFHTRCESGAGLVLTAPVAVTANGRITPGTPGIYDDDHGAAWDEALDAVDHDGPDDPAVGVSLVHAGRRGATRSREYGLDRPLPDDEGWTLYAPSPNPYAPGNRVPERMDETDLDRIREAFVAAAERADAAGFDWLQLHAGHGYLLSSFLSPLTNDRDDEYGGSLEDRARYPLEVYDAVRDVWPDEKPVGVTLQATDWNLRGFTSRAATRVASRLAERDCDLVAVVAGQATVRERPRYDSTTLVDFTDKIRNEAKIPTMSTSYASTFDDVNTLVGAGRADLCAFHPSAFDG